MPHNARLGTLYLNLAEYAGTGVITQRYLLLQSKTCVTLKVSRAWHSLSQTFIIPSSWPLNLNTWEVKEITKHLLSQREKFLVVSLESSIMTSIAPVRTLLTSTKCMITITMTWVPQFSVFHLFKQLSTSTWANINKTTCMRYTIPWPTPST